MEVGNDLDSREETITESVDCGCRQPEMFVTLGDESAGEVGKTRDQV